MNTFETKKWLGFFVGLAVMLCFLLSSPIMAKELHFAVCLPTIDQPHFICQRYGFEDEARKLGVKVTVYNAGGYAYLQKQIQHVEDAIARKVDVIIVNAIEAKGTVPVVEEAVRAGIPVVNVNCMTDSPKVIARVRSSDEEIGRLWAEALAKQLNYKGNIVLLPGGPGVPVTMARANAGKETLKKYPGITILAELYAEEVPVKGMNLMEDLLQTYGEKLNGSYSAGHGMGTGSVMTLQAAKRPDVVVVSVDFSQEMEQLIRDGSLYGTVIQQTTLMGRMGIRVAKAVAEGKKFEADTYTPVKLITRENLDTIDRSGFECPAISK